MAEMRGIIQRVTTADTAIMAMATVTATAMVMAMATDMELQTVEHRSLLKNNIKK